MARLVIIETEAGQLGPWNGPFTIEAEHPDLPYVVSAYVMMVVNGVSSYNKNEWEQSSLLRSYAVECFEEIRDDNPPAGALLENIEVDISQLPDALRTHPMWKLSRAILSCLPGMVLID